MSQNPAPQGVDQRSGSAARSQCGRCRLTFVRECSSEEASVESWWLCHSCRAVLLPRTKGWGIHQPSSTMKEAVT